MMPLKKRVWAWYLATLLLFCATDAVGASVGRWINRSTHVALVSITEGKSTRSAPHRDCAFEYRVVVERNYRGSAELSRLITDAKLTIGGEYLLVIAAGAPWASRAIANDVTIHFAAAQKPVSCETKFPGTLLVRNDEIRPVREGGASWSQTKSLLSYGLVSRWVVFPPYVFLDYSSVSHVSDMDRLTTTDFKAEWPGTDYNEYLLLTDLTGLLREAPSQPH